MFAYTKSRPSSVSIHQTEVSKHLIIQACLRHPCTLALREMRLCFAGFEPVIYYLNRGTFPSYPDFTWGFGSNNVPLNIHTLTVFVASFALSRSELYGTTCTVSKASSSISKYHPFGGYIHCKSHLVHPKNRLPRFVNRNFWPLAGIHVVIRMYFEADRGQRSSRREVCPSK